MSRTQSTHPTLDYLDQLKEPFATVIQTLHRQICLWQPDLEVKLWQSMGHPIIGYGQTTYQLASGKSANWFIVGLAAHKNYCSLYVWGWVNQQSLLEAYREQLGKVRMGRSCLNFKSLADLQLPVIQQMIQKAVQLATSQNQD